MTFKKQKFSQDNNAEFYTELRARVGDYFEENNISKNANANMVIKTIFMFSLYFVPYGLMLGGVITSVGAMVGMFVLMGFGMAGIGLSVMHDACHGSYSSKKWVNDLMSYSMMIVGGNSEIWKLQHNVLHHTYTNIDGADDDIATPGVVRFSPYAEKKPWHKFQFLYVWFLYGISTFFWITSKEFAQVARYRKMGLISDKKRYNKILAQLIGFKAAYYVYALILPIVFMPQFSPWAVFGAFCLMHFTTGLILSMIFQTAHVMPECDYQAHNPSKKIENSWAVHEMETTANYAPKSGWFTWYVGCLNFQVEHHLFPDICNIHYKKISGIVESTAKEYCVPYYTHKTFLEALQEHVKMLRKLGTWEKVDEPAQVQEEMAATTA